MTGSFLEIIELPSGEIVLRRSDEEDAEPLIKMTFSKEVLEYLQGDHFDVAKAMIDACINEVERKSDMESEDYIPDDRVLH